jgi:hypothetical protein
MFSIQTRNNKTQFLPGEEITGTVSGQLEPEPAAIELRLFWYTQGKGTQDVAILATIQFENPGPQDRREFRIQLPDGPYSFSGKLISLVWALELVVLPSEEASRLDITVSPTGREVLLNKEP